MRESEQACKWGPSSALLGLFVLWSLAACGGDSRTGADAGDQRLEPTFNNIQEHIFDRACATAGCHGEGASAGGLDLSSAQVSHDGLVGVPANNTLANQNGWLLVKPGDPELSFLVRKLGTQGIGEGAPMPITTQLTPFYQDLIRNWILAGAQR